MMSSEDYHNRKVNNFALPNSQPASMNVNVSTFVPGKAFTPAAKAAPAAPAKPADPIGDRLRKY